MGVVYIVGAGASSDLYPTDPYSSAHILREKISRFSLPLAMDFFTKAIQQRLIKSETHQALLQVIHDQWGVSFESLRIGKPVSVEVVYTFLTEAINRLMRESSTDKVEEAGRVVAAKWMLDEALEEMFQRARHFVGPCANYMDFARLITKRRAHVISFNWDTLLDEALALTGQWFYESGYGWQFNWVYQDARRTDNRSQKPSSVWLLKPHGSMNWFQYGDLVYEGNKHYPGEEKYYTGEHVSYEERQWVGLFEFSRGPRAPFQPSYRRLNGGRKFSPLLKMPAQIAIVPPGGDSAAPFIGRTWQLLHKVVSEAQEIIVIGYAMKNSDERAIDAFRKARGGNRIVKVTVVGGRDADSIATEKRTRSIFDPCKVSVLQLSFSDYCMSSTQTEQTRISLPAAPVPSTQGQV